MRMSYVALISLLFALQPSAHAAIFEVTTEADSGGGSLRSAIIEANSSGDNSTITFAVGVTEILLATALPPLTNSPFGVIIDGAGVVTLDGRNVPGSPHGFTLNDSNSHIRGMNIINFEGSGILIGGANNSVRGCRIGLDDVQEGPNSMGIFVPGSFNIIGGALPSERNIVSANSNLGIDLIGDSNTVTGNFVGLDAAGELSQGNASSGVYVGFGADNNIVGPGNVISGNGAYGVEIFQAGSSNVIVGNLIGTNASGAGGVANLQGGIGLTSSSNVRIGGATATDRNIISGNGVTGIRNNFALNNQVLGNYIGLDITGTLALPNAGDGIFASGAHGIVIGGIATGEGNLIASNIGDGIGLLNVDGGTIQGNRLGVNTAGDASPLQDGISITGSDDILIGGTAAGGGNEIAFSSGFGVTLSNSQQIELRRNSIYASEGAPAISLDSSNSGIALPVITSITPISGTAPANAIVEIFADDGDEGRIYLASAQANILGMFSSNFDTTPFGGMNITATATDASGNSSGFSAPFAIPVPPHSADTDPDNVISLAETLRVIQFFNSDGLHCQTGTEDGFETGTGDQNCLPHSSDYNFQDWLIGLSELLRLIQFFNMGGYHACEETEDGYCAGLV